jgi:hypothetical protein
MRKRTFLENDDWRVITTTINSKSDLLHYQLVDIMASIPGLHEQSDLEHSTKAASGGYFKISDILLEKVIGVISQLFRWRWAWERFNPNFVFEVPVKPGTHFSVDEKGLPLFKTIFFYRNFYNGRPPIYYNAALLILFSLLEDCGVTEGTALAIRRSRTDERITRTNPLTLPHEHLSMDEVSEEICRSIEFFLSGKERMSGVLNLILPIRTVLDVLKDSPERIWLHNVLDKVGVGRVFGVSKRIRRMDSLLNDVDSSKNR